MNFALILVWSLIYSMIFVILLILLKRGLWGFLDKILPFSFLRENYDKSIHIDNLTFQGQSLWLFILSCILGFSILLFPNPNQWGALGFFVIFFIPGLLLLLRIQTFNDKNILSETGLGYNPMKTWLLSFLGGALGFMYGFFGLGFDNLPTYVSIILIVLAFISCMVPMFPDYINKFLSYDIRSKKGSFFMYKLMGVMIFIQIMFLLSITIVV